MTDKNCKRWCFIPPPSVWFPVVKNLTCDGSSKMLFQILLSKLFKPPVLHHNNQEISNGGRWDCRDCLVARPQQLLFWTVFNYDCSAQLLKGVSLEWVKQRTQYCKYASWQSWSKPRSGKGTQNRSFGVSTRHSCQKTWESTFENGQQAKQIKFFIHENRAARPHSVHWWLSHQRPVRVGLHCQAYTIHEDSAAYTVSTSSLTREVEEVTIGDKPHIPSSSQIQRDCYEKWNETPHWNVSMVDIHLRKLGRCTASLDMPPEWRETTEQTDWREYNPNKWLASRRKIWSVKMLETTCGAQSQGHHATDCSPGGERRCERGSARRSFLRGPSPVRRTLEPFQGQR